jgi:hypothetical protein
MDLVEPLSPANMIQNTAEQALPAAYTDLEAQLQAPEGAALRHAHLTRLHALAARLHTELSRGLGPESYATGRALAHAIDAAITILDGTPSGGEPAGRGFTPAPPHSTPR